MNLYLNISYFIGNITGNNMNNLSLIIGKTLATSYLLINNTYICVRGWYPNNFGIGTTNVTAPSQILQTNITSFAYSSGNYYAVSGTNFNST